MIRKCIIDRRAARSTNQWHSLGHKFLRYGHAKMRSDLPDKADERRRSHACRAASQMACRFGHRFRQNGPKREIARFKYGTFFQANLSMDIPKFEGPIRCGLSPKREHLKASEHGSRILEVVSLSTGDIRDRSQDDRGRERQFEWQARNSKRAASRPG